MAFKKRTPKGGGSTSVATRQGSALVGVDISNSAVKMVQLSQKGKGYHLDGYSIVPFPKELVVDGRVADIDALAQHVRQAWTAQGGGTKSVVAALPSAMVTFKTFTHPAEDSKGLEAAAEFEASQLISLDEVNLDFQIIGAANNMPDEVEVLLCAARKEAVEEREAIVNEAGLSLSLLDVDAFATVNAVEFILSQAQRSWSNQTIAVFDIGATKMQCHVMRNGRLLYYKDQSVGGHQLSRDIQRRYGITYEEADQGKRTNNLPAGYEVDVRKPFIDGLVQEIHRSLQFFYSTVNVAQYQQIDMILLAGGTGALPTLEEAVQAKTQISTMTLNPFANISSNSNIALKQLVQDAPSLLVAFGLALRRFA
ncbi:type IV pilus assembly protein PilM [Neisseria sp. Ec49-e6-T10]|uniref:type IV pilus assembly protein PilM n=1 Tax=Neisseria sp. Ec49-e6-T10 TaxID=3140744 RepID=UPI003EB83C4C